MWSPSWCTAHDLNISSTTKDRVCGVPPGVQRMTLIVMSTTEDRVCGVPPGVEYMTSIVMSTTEDRVCGVPPGVQRMTLIESFSIALNVTLLANNVAGAKI